MTLVTSVCAQPGQGEQTGVALKHSRCPRQDGASTPAVGAWRSTRAHRSPIPEPLWALAVQLARRHGIFATARALRLDYTRLIRELSAGLRNQGSNPAVGQRVALGDPVMPVGDGFRG